MGLFSTDLPPTSRTTWVMTVPSTMTVGSTCQWCGWYHETVCPRIRSIEYWQNGAIRKVEFHDTAKAALLQAEGGK